MLNFIEHFVFFLIGFFAVILMLASVKWLLGPSPADEMEDGEEASEEIAVECYQENLAWEVLEEIYNEWLAAKRMHRTLSSSHEALAVMQEEVFELQTEVFSNEKKNPLRMEKMRAEAIQVGAMALRLITDVCDKPTEVQ
jgi:hypothetical protein